MHRIYWFSGTGNTRYLAREFAAMFPDAELISIASLDRSEDIELDADITGIFFPVYCFGIPQILERFLQRIKPFKEQNNKFIYAVCTSGGYPGAALPIVEDSLQEKNICLNACFHIRMVSGYIPLSEPPDEKHQQVIAENASRALRIAAVAVKKHRKTRPLRVFPIDTLLKFVARRAVATLKESDQSFHVDTERCNGCGLCFEICPASNISLNKEDQPVWHHHCEQCMACLQWCPEKAILYKNLPADRKHYHHPEVQAKELFRSQKTIDFE